MSEEQRATLKEIVQEMRREAAKRKLPERIKNIDVVRWQDGKIYVLGSSESRPGLNVYNHSVGRGRLFYAVHNAETGEIIEEDSFKYSCPLGIETAVVWSLLGVGIPFLINTLRPSKFERRRKTAKHSELVEQFLEANQNDLNRVLSKIRLYQGTINEVGEDLGEKLERVDTSRVETFLRARSSYGLQLRAYELGADAVVHYQPGSSIGTPVRFKGE